MATFCVSSLRLFKFIKTSRLLSEIMPDISISRIGTFENILLVQNVRVFSKDTDFDVKNTFGKPEVARKKTVPIPKILLLSPEGKVIEQLTLEEAQQLAKRRNLSLVQVVDFALKTSLPTYQLMSKTQLIQEEVKVKRQKAFEKSTSVKTAKLIIISCKIEKHDLETKINKMIKLLKKNHKVQVFVSVDGNKTLAEAVIKTIENSTIESGILQNKVPKASGMKLYLDPILPNEAKKDTSS